MKLIQNTIDKFIKWGKGYGLKFNSEKTVVVLFSRRLIKRIPPKLIINQHPVPFSETMRYLGVFIDNKLTWKTHIEKTLKICKQNLMYTANVIRKNGEQNQR